MFVGSSLLAIVGLLALGLFLTVVIVALAAETIGGAFDRLSRDRNRVGETVGADPHDPTETALPDDPRDD